MRTAVVWVRIFEPGTDKCVRRGWTRFNRPLAQVQASLDHSHPHHRVVCRVGFRRMHPA